MAEGKGNFEGITPKTYKFQRKSHEFSENLQIPKEKLRFLILSLTFSHFRTLSPTPPPDPPLALAWIWLLGRFEAALVAKSPYPPPTPPTPPLEFAFFIFQLSWKH